MERKQTRLADLSREDLMRRLLDAGYLNPMAELRVRGEFGIEGQTDSKNSEGPKILGTLQTNGLPVIRQPV